MLKILRQKPVFKGKLFTVFEDEVQPPGGERRVFYSAIRKPSVSVVPIDDKGNVYLVDQYRYLHKKRLIEVVAGIIDEGESPQDAAKRELKEELGIIAKKWKKLGVVQSAGSIITWDQHIFLAQDLKFEDQNLEDVEDITMKKMSLKDAIKDAMKGKIHTSSTLNAIFMSEKSLK